MTAFWAFLDETYAGFGFLVGVFVTTILFIQLIRWRDRRRGTAPQMARAASTQASLPEASGPAVPRCERCGAECPTCRANPPGLEADCAPPVHEAPGLGTGADGIVRDAGMLPAFREHCRRMDEAVAAAKHRPHGQQFCDPRRYVTADALLRQAGIHRNGRRMW